MADQQLDIQILKEIAKGKFCATCFNLGRRRRAIEHVTMVIDVSERRVCRVAGQHRSTQRRTAPPNPYRDKLVARMRELAVANAHRGRRSLMDLLRKERWSVGARLMKRLWRQATWDSHNRNPTAPTHHKNHRRARVRESSAHRRKQLVFRSKQSRPSFDSLARRSALDSCPILRATSCCLQSCAVSAMIPSAHPSRPRSKLQPRARLFASSTLVFRCAMTACHSRADSLL